MNGSSLTRGLGFPQTARIPAGLPRKWQNSSGEHHIHRDGASPTSLEAAALHRSNSPCIGALVQALLRGESWDHFPAASQLMQRAGSMQLLQQQTLVPCTAPCTAIQGVFGWTCRKSLRGERTHLSRWGEQWKGAAGGTLGGAEVRQCESWSLKSLARHRWSEAVLVSGLDYRLHFWPVPQVMAVHVSGKCQGDIVVDLSILICPSSYRLILGE